jgi:hypothetical protein
MKAIKVYEILNFERGQDPKHSMKIGQDHIKQILIGLFPQRKPGERDYDLHQNIINKTILNPQFVVSLNKEDNIITVKNESKIPYSPFETLFNIMIEHINRYSFPLDPKITRIVDSMDAPKNQIQLKILKE